MSEATRMRIQILQHRRRQDAAARRIASLLKPAIGRDSEMPRAVPAEISRALEQQLDRELASLRTTSRLRKERFQSRDDAVLDLLRHSRNLGDDAMWEYFDRADASGFFVGAISTALVGLLLDDGIEGIAVTRSDIQSGALLDIVRDDPMEGDFVDVEWW